MLHRISPKEYREEAFVAAARALASMDKWVEVSTWAERGLALSLNTEHTPWLHHLYGVSGLYFGDCYRSVRCLRRFDQEARRRPEFRSLLEHNWAALGETYRNLRDLPEEVSSFRKAARFFEAQGVPQKAADCIAEVAWSFLTNEQPSKARPSLTWLRRSAHGGRPKPQLAIALSAVTDGKPAEAIRTCHNLLAGGGLTHEQKCDVLWIRARAHWQAGEAELARFLALAARQFSLNPWSPHQNARVDNLIERMKGDQHIPA